MFNSLLIFLEFEHMHTYKIGPLPFGYLPFFLFLAIIIFLSITSFLNKPGTPQPRQSSANLPSANIRLAAHRRLPTALALPAVCLLAYSLASSLWVVHMRSWATYTCMWSFYIGCFWLLAAWVPNHMTWKQCKSIHTYTAYATVFTALVGILRYTLLHQPDANPWPLINRNGFVFFLVPSVPIIIAICETERKNRVFSTALLMIAIAACALTFSRMGMMGMAIAVGLYFLYPSARTLARGIVAVMLALIAFWLVAKYVPHVQDKVQSVLATVTSLLDSAEIEEGQLDYRRFVLLEEAKAIVKSHWILGTGVGLENYLEYFRASMHPMKPHNLYLSYLAELGLFGFSCLLAFLFGIFFVLLRATRKSRNTEAFPIAKAMLCGHVAVLFMFIFNEYITSPTVWTFWGIAVGTALLIDSRIPTQQRSAKRILT